MIVQLKHSSNTGNTPVALANGELALNASDQLLYYRHANGALAILANGASLVTLALGFVYSTQNQAPGNTAAHRIDFNNQGILEGITHTNGEPELVVLANGWYSITASGNYRRTGGGSTVRYADTWIRRNNINLDGAITRTSMIAVTQDHPMHLSTLVYLEANDVIELLQAVDSTTGSPGLRDRAGLTGAPAVPSVSLWIKKVAN